MANLQRSALRTEVYTRLAENTGFFTDTQINQWLADGVEDYAIRAEPLVTPTVATILSGIREYQLPSDIISVKFVLELNGVNWDLLAETTYDALFHANPTWENSSALIATNWYWLSDRIGLYPKPSVQILSGLKIVYSYKPGAMSGDAATTGLPEWADKAITAYAAYRACQRDRSRERASDFWNEYLDQVKVGVNKLAKHRKEHGAKFVPTTSHYRGYFGSRRLAQSDTIFVNS